MKKLSLILIALASTLSMSYATGIYTGEKTKIDKKYCYYTDGTVITVSFWDQCPTSI